MPKVKDKLGNVVAELPYDQAGEAQAEEIVKDNPNFEIDYSPGGISNAPDTRDSYQLGGLIPGQTGFGQKPGVNISQDLRNPLEGANRMNPFEWPEPDLGDNFNTGMYKKGGKVKK
jgi:hypothetical protein